MRRMRGVTAVAIVAVAAGAQDAPAPGAARPAPMLLPQVLVLPRGDRELRADGSLGDWPELPGVRIDDQRQVSGSAFNAWIGPADLGAQAFCTWDPDALWLGIAVKDEWHRALDASTMTLTEIPAADSVVVTFDPDRDTRAAGDDPGRREDREFWLADEAGRQVVLWDRLRGSARMLDADRARVVALHDKEHGITTYEARIPWAEILPPGRNAEAGLVLDVQIVVNDYDESTDTMAQSRVGLTFGCGPVIDPGLLATMMLLPDAAALRGVVPPFPPKPSVPEVPHLLPRYWQQWTASLLASPPEVYDGTRAPQECGGSERLALLEQLDERCASMPRVDFVELHHRIHRRMTREVAGLHARGLPRLWRERLVAVSREAEDPVPEGAARVFRLPMGGWLVRSAQRNFAIDPAGADLEKLVWGGIEFCVLTQPLDLTRRNDQLLVRMYAAEPPRPVLTHIRFHLPLIPMDLMPLVEPGEIWGSATGARVTGLGHKRGDGAVPWSYSYRIELPQGPTLLVVGPSLLPAEVDAGAVDLAIVSPRNPDLLAIVQKVAPALVTIDDAFTCSSHPTQPRLSLRELFALQQELRPVPSVLLAPGESWTVRAKGR